ncbi:outer membrane protein assembly factor BamB family protein [Paraoerskovia marina]|nr:PQQ-binding-like beta-propeller repeat protein [Paraoerskovia marina]
MVDRGDFVELDISATTAAGDDGGDAPAEDDESPQPTRRRRWRGVAIVVGIATAVVGGLYVGTGVQEQRATAARLADGHGLRSVPEAPDTVWSTPARYGVLRDDVVVAVDGSVARGHDPATGAELWSYDLGLGENPSCGVEFGFRGDELSTGDPLVCLSRALPYEVAVVDDGELTAQRVLDLPAGASVAPGPGGSLVVAQGDGDPVDATVLLDELASIEGLAPDPDLVPLVEGVDVAAQDAVSDEPLWTRHLEPHVVDNGWRCVELGEGDDSYRFAGAGEASVLSGAGLVQVLGCGVSATLSADGTVLAEPGSGETVVPLPGGLLARNPDLMIAVEPGPSEVLDRQGEVLHEVPGTILSPSATDGTGSPTFVANGSLRAFDGTQELWSAPVGAEQVLAVTGQVVVAATSYAIQGLDRETGQMLWEQDVTASAWLSSAFVDDERLILLATDQSNPEEGLTQTLTAYGLRDGEVRWQQPVPDGPAAGTSVQVADGRMVVTDGATVSVVE